MRLSQHLILRNWISGIHRARSRSIHPTVEKSEGKNKIKIWDASLDRQPKIQYILSGGDSSKNYGTDQQKMQNSDLHLDKFPTPATFACWKIRFKTEVFTILIRKLCNGSKKWRWLIQFLNLRHHYEVIQCQPNFEVLHAKIASALNRIIHNSHFRRRSCLEEQKAQKQDRFLRGRQIAYLIYEYFRVTGANDSVENYADLFTIGLRNDDIQEFDSKWDGILSMTKMPPDDILERSVQIKNTRVWETQDRIGTVHDLEIHQKKLGPDYHRLKTMVKRSIEQDIWNKNLGARNGNFEKNAVVKNQGNKIACTKNSWRLLAMGVQRAVY